MSFNLFQPRLAPTTTTTTFFGFNSICSIQHSMSNNCTKTTTHARARTTTTTTTTATTPTTPTTTATATTTTATTTQAKCGWHPGTPATKRQKRVLPAKGARKGECQRLKRRRPQDGNGAHLRPEHGDRGVSSALNKLGNMRSPCVKGKQSRSHREAPESIAQPEWCKRRDPCLVERNKWVDDNDDDDDGERRRTKAPTATATTTRRTKGERDGRRRRRRRQLFFRNALHRGDGRWRRLSRSQRTRGFPHLSLD
jgi:hypothetical protein